MTRGDRAPRRAPAVLAAGVLAAVGFVPSACAGYSCEGPAVYPPSVYVEAGAWFDAHPGSTSVRACLGTTCEDVGRSDPWTQVVVPRGSDDGRLDVVVTLRTDGRTATHDLTVALGATSVTGPCGTVTNRGRVVAVAADGTLTAAGVRPDAGGAQTRRASTTSSPAPSPTG